MNATLALELSAESTRYSQVLAQARAIKVQDQGSLGFALELTRLAKENWARLEARRTEITKPLLAAKRSVDDLFSGPLSALKAVESHLKGEMGAYHQAVAQEQARVNQVNAASIAAGVVPTEHPPESPALEGASIRTSWVAIVVDEALVPRELCSPDPAKIARAIWYADTPHSPPRPIPGLRFEQRSSVAVRK